MKHKPASPVTTISVAIITACSLLACEPATQPGFVGTLERDRVELKVETNEPLIAIHVFDGQMVSKGSLLLEQDASRARARRAQQLAHYEQAAARLAELQRGPRKEAIEQGRAQLEGLQALSINAEAELKRSQKVFDKGLSDQAVLDQASANWKSAIAQEKAARESLAALLTGTTIEELQQAAAVVAAAQASLDQAEIDLNRTQIFAPVDGRIDQVLFELGERPSVGSTVAVLLDAARIYARVYVPEAWRASVLPGLKLSVQIDGVDDTMQGTVRWVSSDASFTPYFALTEHDRGRLTYLAEIDVETAAALPVGTPLVVLPPSQCAGKC